MLWKNGLVKREEAKRILEGLNREIKLNDKAEDIHEALEDFLINFYEGYNINLGKSRNDQVATALRMRLRSYLLDIMVSIMNLVHQLLIRAEENKNTIMAGYTHLQRAQPISLASHLLSYVFPLIRDIKRFLSCYDRLNECPMGSGALAATTLPIDREFVSNLLGFNKPMDNSIDGVSSRDFIVEALANLSILMLNLSSLAEDLILWSSKEFDFIELDDKYSSSSSMMPQKKNPVVAELIRAKTGSCISHLLASLTILKSLPRSYNLDLQEINHHLWLACKDTLNSLRLMSSMIGSIKVKRENLLKNLLKDYTILATDLAEYLALNYSIPFRKAHKLVGALVKRDFKTEDLPLISKRILGEEINLKEEELRNIFDFNKALNRRKVLGGVSPKASSLAIKKAKISLERLKILISKRRESLEKSFKRIKDYEVEIIGE